MLDKSIPYKHILMKRPKGATFKKYPLPAGYSFVDYEAGDELHWAEIETSVGEFKDTESALLYYRKEFLSHAAELKERQRFIQDEKGKKIATISAWWKYTEERRDALIHWVAVKPEHQGKGLGKPLTAEGIRRLLALEGDVDQYLHTQTWSHKAINIYLDAGFEFMKQECFAGFKNEYEEAIKIIGDKLSGASVDSSKISG